MAEEPKADQLNSLRSFELRLLRCSVPSDYPPPPSSPPPSHSSSATTSSSLLHALIDDVLQLIEVGEYARALTCTAVQTVFKFDSSGLHFWNSLDSARLFYSELVLNSAESFIVGDKLKEGDDDERCCRAFLVMAIAVAAFLAFTQCNMTGPIEKLPLVPLMVLEMKEKEGAGGAWAEWEAWARNELMSVGSDLLGNFSYLQYMVFAKVLLLRIKDMWSQGNFTSMDGYRSISWWLSRVLLLQQRILDERSSSLFDLLQVLMHESLHHFGTLKAVKSYWGPKLLEEEALTLVSMLHLEVGIVEHTYGRVDSSRIHFESAVVACGLDVSVTGALGFRTADQTEPRAQLLLVANANATDGGDSCSSGSPELQRNISSTGENNSLQHHHEIYEASHVLMTPRFLRGDMNSEGNAQTIPNAGVAAAHYKAVQQAAILAQCLSIEKNSRSDEYQRYQMAPYIEAIDSQQSSNFTIRCFCDILRIRWESTRSRTKERALLMMDKLVQGVYEPAPGVAQRIYCCYGVYMPTIPALRKEYGDLLVACGLIGEAVKVYEDLELWDNLIYCYRLLEKKAAAVEIIKARLAERPRDPRLWCSLGDVTNNDACYEKALEVSESRSARAKRSLARSAYNRGDYEKSKILWESAMALNSLYPDGWFALGAAALKARDIEKALDGFTRAVQLDPDNGEAWNNIACLHMIRKKNKEAFIAFKEALKFKRNSWQLWENFSQVATDIGNFSQAMEAVQMVLDLTNNKRIDEELLQKLMLEIEGRALTSQSHPPIDTNNDDHMDYIDASSEATCDNQSDVGSARTGETELLFELLGKILRQIVRSGGGAEVWGLYARWHKIKGDYPMCSEALLKQVRSYQGSELWKDKDRFKKFAHASLELCEVYMELAFRTGSRRELLAAEMHLKNTIKQAGIFSEIEEFRDLQACLEKVQMKLLATSVPAA